MADFDINILGCGSALPTTRHLATSQIVDLRDKLYMIDCGEGTQVQMRRMRIKFSRLNHIFISHLHGDHCFGLPGLISTLGMLGRNGELVIHGPKEIESYMRPILDIFCKGLPYEIRFNLIDPTTHSLVMEDRSLSVYSIPLKHRRKAGTTRWVHTSRPLRTRCRPIWRSSTSTAATSSSRSSPKDRSRAV